MSTTDSTTDRTPEPWESIEPEVMWMGWDGALGFFPTAYTTFDPAKENAERLLPSLRILNAAIIPVPNDAGVDYAREMMRRMREGEDEAQQGEIVQGEIVEAQPVGLTRRDLFAATVLNALLASIRASEVEAWLDVFADRSVKAADALIAALGREQGGEG